MCRIPEFGKIRYTQCYQTPSCVCIDNSGMSVQPIRIRLEAQEKARMWRVSHLLFWQKYTVAYGNKCNISSFQALGNSYLQKTPCAENLSLPTLHRCSDRSIAGMQSGVEAVEAVLPYIRNMLLPTRIGVSRCDLHLRC